MPLIGQEGDERRGDPVDRHQVFALVSGQPQDFHQRLWLKFPQRQPVDGGVDDLQRRVEPVKRVAEVGPGVAHDDRRTIDRDAAQPVRAAHELLRCQLAALVVVAELLADVQLVFADDAAAEPADIGRRDMMQFANARQACQLQDVPGAGHIAQPRLFVPRCGWNDKLAAL